jgi:hypothetical protein
LGVVVVSTVNGMSLRRHLRLGIGLAATAALVTLAIALSATPAPAHRLRSGPMRIVRGGAAPSEYVRGSTFVHAGKGRQLAAPVQAPLVGPLAPVAVRSADSRLLAYNTWSEPRPLDTDTSLSRQGVQPGEPVGTPSVRVYDERDGRDSLVERGTYSPAWRADGALAYARGVVAAFRPGEPYLTDVVVRASVSATPVKWSVEPARYVVDGWAGDRLIVYRVGEDEEIDTLVLDGPGRVRLLNQGSVIAISPDGNRVFALGPDNRGVRVLRVSDGGEVAGLDAAATASSYDWLSYAGSWVGDHVVAPASPGLAVFQVGDSDISLEQVLGVDRSILPTGLQEPVLDPDAAHVTATADLPPQGDRPAETFFVNCDRTTRTCLRGDPAPAREWLRQVHDTPAEVAR